MSRAYATPLVLEPRPSRALRLSQAVAHLGAAGVLLALDAWPWPLRLLLAAVLLATGWRSLASQPTLRRLTWQAGNEWRLEGRSGEVVHAHAVAPTVVHPLLVVLRLQPAGRRLARAVVLPADSLEAEVFRRLRVRLRVEGIAAGEVD